MRPDTVDVTDEDCMATLCDNRLVGNSAYYSIPRLTIAFFCPTFLILTEIKFGIICNKIGVVNKSLPYAMKIVARIVTILSFLYFFGIVAEFFTIFFEPALY